MNFSELSENLTQQGIDLKQYGKYLTRIYKHLEQESTPTGEQNDPKSDVVLEMSVETSLSHEMTSPIDTTLEKTAFQNQRVLAKTEKLPIFKSSENRLGDTEPLEPILEKNSAVDSTVALEKNSEEIEDLKRVCIQLLIRSKMEIIEMNQLLRSLSVDQRNARALIQHLLKKKKIRMDECFELEQGQWLPSGEAEKIPFNFKIRNGCPEFVLTEKLTQQKFGHYQIIRELARGGMGIVYKVYHPGLAQYFALKVLIAGENASEETIRRFHREAKNTAKLKHPGIVQVMDSGEEHGRHYFVMEYVEGQTLGQFLKKRPALREGLLIIKKSLEALHFAHTQGIIHRDLKPENIFITQTGEPKIGDFGLAKNIDIDGKSFKITHSGAILGTPAYMSPEQAAGQIHEVDERADVYSMGACMYQLLTQEVPFKAESLHQQLHLIINDEPLPPSRIVPDIHKDVDVMILKSLEKQKAKRYASAMEFAEDIGRFLAGYPIQARPSSRKEHLLKAIKRNQQAFIVGFVLTSLFLVGTIYIQWRRYQEKQDIHIKAETNFQQFFQKANHEILLMGPSESSSDAQKMQHGLNALKFLKRAFQLKPGDSEIRKRKLELTQQLIPISCKLQEYSLADYLVEEALQIPGLEPEKKEFFSLLIDDEKKKLHDSHYKEFMNGVNQLRSEVSTEMEREAILLRICQWKEPQIFIKLQEILQEATEYFLSNRKPDTLSTDFYFTILRVLAHQQNPSFSPLLLQEIEQMSAPLVQSSVTVNPEALYYLILLAQTFSWIPQPEGAETLQKIRSKFGKESLFWKQTESAYSRLKQYAPVSATSESSLTSENPMVTKEPIPTKDPTPTQNIQEQQWLQRGIQKVDKNAFVEAMADLNEVLKINPKNAIAYYYRGLIYYEQGAFSDAVKEFSQAIQWDPQYTSAYNNRALCHLSLQNYDKTIEDLNKALELDPRYVSAYNNRGLAQYHLNQLESAVKDFDRAIQLDPKSAQSYHNRGMVYYKMRKIKELFADIDEAIRLDPKNAMFYRNRGIFRLDQNQYEEGISDFTESIRLNPNDSLSYLYRGQAKSNLEQWQEAIEDVKSFLKRAPETHPDYQKAQEFLTSLQKKKKLK